MVRAVPRPTPQHARQEINSTTRAGNEKISFRHLGKNSPKPSDSMLIRKRVALILHKQELREPRPTEGHDSRRAPAACAPAPLPSVNFALCRYVRLKNRRYYATRFSQRQWEEPWRRRRRSATRSGDLKVRDLSFSLGGYFSLPLREARRWVALPVEFRRGVPRIWRLPKHPETRFFRYGPRGLPEEFEVA